MGQPQEAERVDSQCRYQGSDDDAKNQRDVLEGLTQGPTLAPLSTLGEDDL